MSMLIADITIIAHVVHLVVLLLVTIVKMTVAINYQHTDYMLHFTTTATIIIIIELTTTTVSILLLR